MAKQRANYSVGAIACVNIHHYEGWLGGVDTERPNRQRLGTALPGRRTATGHIPNTLSARTP